MLNEKAVKEWQDLLGTRATFYKPGEFKKTSSVGLTQNILGILKPESTEEISKIIKIANFYKTPFFPVSCGKNWGYGNGSLTPHVILELSQMKKITNFDSDLGLITIEPGVTMNELWNFLKNENAYFVAPSIGGSNDASVVGNLIEKGRSLEGFVDRVSTLHSIEVVLGNGEIYSSFPKKDKNQRAFFKWGSGPYIDGLFTQSNFGVVTQITIVLQRRFSMSEEFLLYCNNENSLSAAVDEVRKIQFKLGGILTHIKIQNERKVLSRIEPFPKNLKSQNEISDHILSRSKALEVPPWVIIGLLQGEKSIIKSAKKIIKKNLDSKGELMFLDKYIALATFYTKYMFFAPKIKKKLNLLKNFFYKPGTKTRDFWQLLLWRRTTIFEEYKYLENIDLDAHNSAGIIFFSAVLPIKGDVIASFVFESKKIFSKYGFEPIFNFRNFTPLCFTISLPILFNKQSSTEIKLAKDCYYELAKKIENKENTYIYRVPIDQTGVLNSNQEYWNTVKKIKTALDPNSVVAPGIYNLE